jgi:hypothetical protein
VGVDVDGDVDGDGDGDADADVDAGGVSVCPSRAMSVAAATARPGASHRHGTRHFTGARVERCLTDLMRRASRVGWDLV